MDQKRACVESIRELVADDSYGSDNWLKRISVLPTTSIEVKLRN